MQPETKTRKNPKSKLVDNWTLRKKNVILRQLLWLRRRTINQLEISIYTSYFPFIMTVLEIFLIVSKFDTCTDLERGLGQMVQTPLENKTY